MTISKENVKLEQRLVRIQNKVAELSAKVDALLGDRAKDVKLPKPEEEPQGSSSQPYTIKPEHELPESTIEPPVVGAEGKTPEQLEEEKRQREEDAKKTPEQLSTIKPPTVETEDPRNPKTPEQRQKEAEEKVKAETESAPNTGNAGNAGNETSRPTPRPTARPS